MSREGRVSSDLQLHQWKVMSTCRKLKRPQNATILS
jgi:hypothetical protein